MLFVLIFQKLVGIYLNIILGYVSGKALKINSGEIAKLIFYVTTPFVILQGALKIHITANLLVLPLIIFLFCSILCLTFYFIAKRYLDNSLKNIVALSAGTGNTGFVGIPLVTLITENNDELIGIYITAMLGVSIYENTLGYVIAAKDDSNHNSIMPTLKRLLKIPIIYAFIIGYSLNFLGVHYHSLPNVITEFLTLMQNCYLVLGILIIGFAMAQVEKLEFDYHFTGLTFSAKFIAWPLVMKIFTLIDKYFLNLYDKDVHYILMIMSIVPLATNTVTISTLLKIYPDKAATTVLLGAAFALVYIPLMLTFVI